jgi:effector-binding domain-containing protein
VRYTGAYESSMDVYVALDKWISEHGYMVAGPLTEVYLKGPGDNVKPEEYLTEIQFEVKKAEAPKPTESKK